MKTLGFGPEANKETARLAEEVARQGAARTGRCRRARQLDVSRQAPARRTGGRFFLRISARSPLVAGDCHEKYRAVLRDDVDGKVGALRDKATTETALKVFERELFRKRRRALREPQGLVAARSGVVPNEAMVDQRMKRARWSAEGGRNVLALGALVGPSGMATELRTSIEFPKYLTYTSGMLSIL